ncbi:glucose 1-dehydrogenase [Aquibacillus sp. 3ASR75-11]|uniref:Glucose 1-dehydrogenase n=1 Tax=Terrihalobacillus insolitus TaxID=2950438 RepID=A0A9X3WNS8_9BACI|nr:glucose 1-dehydrogenase [Terrihalobacillus insolitus]MDC3423417.1 glucose 1-dehydrogenase [Terrihalobacillus insolitus]
MRLKDKVIIITGAGSGIGKETAILFAKEGATIVVNDLNEESGQQTIDEIHSNNGKALFIQGNVTKTKDVQYLVDEVIKKFGRIDVLFNNAGISGVGQLHEIEPETWEQVFKVNVYGVFLVSKYVIPHMMERRSGAIINMSSCIAEIGLANRASYAATKGAVLSLTKSMQVDYAKYNLRINALMPGTIYTPFVENYISKSPDPEKTISTIKKRQLGEELGKPIDVAYAALYLASDESKFMMGAHIYIDGGVVNGK